MTHKQTLKAIQAYGLLCTYNPITGEYYIARPSNNEEYYTYDPDDAICTAAIMAAKPCTK